MKGRDFGPMPAFTSPASALCWPPPRLSSTVVLRGHYIEVVACSSMSRHRMHCTSTDLAAPSFPPDDVRKVPLHRPSLYATVGATSLSTTAEWGCDEKSWDSDFALGDRLPRADRQYLLCGAIPGRTSGSESLHRDALLQRRHRKSLSARS